ncbi:MAG: hypothetical protein IJC43_09615 [Clostridia bacterium]|nr:hypothetical protein [Clostridia bacterium]
MTREQYLQRFSRTARWFLSAKEAREVTADYEEFLIDRPPEEMEPPFQVVRAIADPGLYRRWITTFSLMLRCLLLPCYFVWFTQEHHPALTGLLWAAGLLLALRCFRTAEAEGAPLPRPLLPLLLLLTVTSAALNGLTLWLLVHTEQIQTLAQQIRNIGTLFTSFYYALTVLTLLLGGWGLVQARLSHPRWRALYILCLTSLLVSVMVLQTMHSLSLDHSAPRWWVPLVLRCCTAAAVGGTAAGVSLC